MASFSLTKESPNDHQPHGANTTSRILLSIAILGVAFIIAEIVYFYSNEVKVIPKSDDIYIFAIITLVSGYLIIRIVSTLIEKLIDPRLGVTRSHAIKNFFQIVTAILLVIVVLTFFGPNLTNLLIGAGFIGIVLGLAAQQILGNLFAGIALVSSRPFEIGERLTLITLGYGLNAMTYSHENLFNGYTGVVRDIGIFYTRLQTDEGVPLVLPNSVVIGSLVMNHSRVRERTVRLRMDLEKRIDLNEFKSELASLLKSSGSEIIEPETLRVDITDVGQLTYQVVMLLWTKSMFEEPVKTVIGLNAMEAQRRVLAKHSSSESSGK